MLRASSMASGGGHGTQWARSFERGPPLRPCGFIVNMNQLTVWVPWDFWRIPQHRTSAPQNPVGASYLAWGNGVTAQGAPGARGSTSPCAAAPGLWAGLSPLSPGAASARPLRPALGMGTDGSGAQAGGGCPARQAALSPACPLRGASALPQMCSWGLGCLRGCSKWDGEGMQQ